MEKIEFCDQFCPIPARWQEFLKVDEEYTVDCDMEEMECPFKDVDFDKVSRNEIIETRGILELQKIIDHNHKMLRKVK